MLNDPHQASSSNGSERRRGRRVPLTFEVEVSGMGESGVPYRDAALASDVSERGCKLHLAREVKTGDRLIIRVLRKTTARDQQETPFPYQAVWVVPGENTWTAGLAALKPGNPWGMNFPPVEELVPE